MFNTRGDAVVIHSVTESSEWPLPVHSLSQLLGQHLPDFLASGTYPFVSPRASYLLQEITEELSAHNAMLVDGPEQQPVPLVGVFDAVLSTVADIRDVMEFRNRGIDHHTITFWSPLLSYLGRSCSEQASIL